MVALKTFLTGLYYLKLVDIPEYLDEENSSANLIHDFLYTAMWKKGIVGYGTIALLQLFPNPSNNKVVASTKQ